ncbi:saccharopine dehydrogenase-like oxidoreductase [Toxorhynchites rutilus septentrionalis]|uniref:saccharopine dehydrogenase-like oxidoreductase n=1 Tax=Toxorhynchites rutilus septentrionalis TaxID=329112 RepID=UPI0024787ABF|nr:saccharopine dehydrogenase-like oxidoreductase [Toxorhynchites rutilus septentrionalis]XP_055622746.1 saccharopine dehydrogenase-like oxidoreductase [Toxorhynchites rutilus septentrionalis]
MTAERQLDVIIFGASGFTGKHTIYQGIKLLEGLKWGIAGRSKDKLTKVLTEVEKKADKDLSETPIIVADVKDPESLKKMAEQCKIVVNCCGPYRFFGEPVVKACVEAGTHHVDVSGEPQYMERMQLQYNEQAREKGVYIVSACGFDSIPADLGTVFLEKQFDGVVNSVETFLESSNKSKSTGGAVLHYGTWESAIYGLAHANELRELRSQLFQTRLPNFQPRLKDRPLVHKSKFVNNRWCLPFPGSDRSVVLRSQRFFYDNDKKRPVQMKAYMAFDSIFHVIAVALIGAIFALMTRTKLGRQLLLKYPRFFSVGFASHEGPTEEAMENTEFAISFKGEGWNKDEEMLEPSDQYKVPPNKKLKCKVSGTNPGYGATCVALLLSAITILKESDKMPFTGGVYPPGAAFYKTNLIEKLCENGFKFEVLKD